MRGCDMNSAAARDASANRHNTQCSAGKVASRARTSPMMGNFTFSAADTPTGRQRHRKSQMSGKPCGAQGYDISRTHAARVA